MKSVPPASGGGIYRGAESITRRIRSATANAAKRFGPGPWRFSITGSITAPHTQSIGSANASASNRFRGTSPSARIDVTTY